MPSIDLSQFHVVEVTTSQRSGLAFSVMLDHTLRLNGRLCEKIAPGFLRIHVGPGGTQLPLEPVERDQPNARSAPKSGTVHCKELIQALSATSKNRIPLPAKYIVDWDEEIKMWVGVLDPDFHFPVPKGKPSSKRLYTPRKSGLQAMMP